MICLCRTWLVCTWKVKPVDNACIFKNWNHSSVNLFCCLLFRGDKAHFRDRNSHWEKSAAKVWLTIASSWAGCVRGFCLLMQRTWKTPLCTGKGFVLFFFFSIYLLLPCQISLVVDESLRLDCSEWSEPLPKRLVGAFTRRGSRLTAWVLHCDLPQWSKLCSY